MFYKYNTSLFLYCISKLGYLLWLEKQCKLSMDIVANNHFKHQPENDYYKKDYQRIKEYVKKDKQEIHDKLKILKKTLDN